MHLTYFYFRFYRDDISRRELYTRYIYKLQELHVEARSWAEAAFTLQLHARQLDWGTRMLHADLQFPTQQAGLSFCWSSWSNYCKWIMN